MKTNSLILIDENNSYFIEDTLNKQIVEVSKNDYEQLLSESVGSEKISDSRLLCEFTTIKGWIGKMSQIIRRTSGVRKATRGKESQLSKFVGITGNRNNPILNFTTKATFSTKIYKTQIQLVDLNLYLGKKHIFNLTKKGFKTLLSKCKIKTHCQCTFYHWGGLAYELSRVNGAINPVTIPNPIWRTRKGYKPQPSQCKHLTLLLPLIIPNSDKIFEKIKKKYPYTKSKVISKKKSKKP